MVFRDFMKGSLFIWRMIRDWPIVMKESIVVRAGMVCYFLFSVFFQLFTFIYFYLHLLVILVVLLLSIICYIGCFIGLLIFPYTTIKRADIIQEGDWISYIIKEGSKSAEFVQ